MDIIKKISDDCMAMKLKALEMALSTGSYGSHIGGAFSAMELLASLFEIVNNNDLSDNRDRIILSKGHAVLALYTALWRHGILSDEQLLTFDKDGTDFHGHPHRNLDYRIEFSGGSLGLGLSYAVGVALACRRKQLNNRIFCIIGDGECQEGIIWEALMSAANYNLGNLTVIVDNNKFQLDGLTDSTMKIGDLESKFKAFGFNCKRIDGHNISEIMEYLTQRLDDDIPQALIANTVKAHGISFLENNKLSHQCPISKKKYDIAVNDIKKAYGID